MNLDIVKHRRRRVASCPVLVQVREFKKLDSHRKKTAVKDAMPAISTQRIRKGKNKLC